MYYIIINCYDTILIKFKINNSLYYNNNTVRQNLTFSSYGDHHDSHFLNSRSLNPNPSAKDAHHVRFLR